MSYLKLFTIAAFAIGAILYMARGDDHIVVVGDQNYSLEEYVKISVNNDVDVRVKAGEDYALNVRADEADLKNLKIYVKGQTLVIENREMMFGDWRGERPEIEIYLPYLKKFYLNGSGDARIEEIHGEFFTAMVNGSGSVQFAGRSDSLMAQINGSGSLDGTAFYVKDCEIGINGSGSSRMVGECQDLEIDINGSGDFMGRDFKCEKVEIDIAGSGDLVVYASKMLKVDVTGSGEIDVYGKPEYVKDRSRDKANITLH